MPPASSVALIDLLEYPALRYGPSSDADLLDGALAAGILPAGQYAFAQCRGASILLARDPVGCNKLFFGRDRAGALVVANRLVRLWQAGVPLSSIASCPPGHVLEVTGDVVRKVCGRDVFDVPADPAFAVADLQRDVRATLDRGFAWLAREFADSRFVVCLSGGLDSSVVASFASAHLPGVTAASFTYLNDEDLRSHARGGAIDQLESTSEDFRAAARVAASLAMPLLPVVRPGDALASAVRASVQLCQDWRDFNVHCATVNLFLAQEIRAANPGRPVVVLTGDLVNELVTDYREERIGDAVYYRVPRVPAQRRRQYFLRGLDAGDREIGVFGGYGLTCCQPFALVVDNYLRVPAAMLDEPDVKWTLNGALLAPQVTPHVSRSKTRAQVGGKDMGTLGRYHEWGIDEAALRNVWHQQFPGEAPKACDELIQFGRYRLPAYGVGG